MVEVGGLPAAYWDPETLSRSDYQDFKWALEVAKIKLDEEWAQIEKLLPVYPQFFPTPEKVTKDLYMWANRAVQSRVFGWGTPTVALAPLADFHNHGNDNSVQITTIDKNLHKQQNKIYLYHHNFEKVAKKTYTDADLYHLETSKLKINCARLFKEDKDVPQAVVDAWEYKPLSAAEQAKLYSRDLCLERYKYNRDKNTGTGQAEMDQQQEEQMKKNYKLDAEPFGQQLWGIGYVSSDWEAEEDEGEADQMDEEELTEECELERKILDGVELEMHEMETVSDSTRLRDVYNHRWWKIDADSYFTLYNHTREVIRAGQQVTLKYG